MDITDKYCSINKNISKTCVVYDHSQEGQMVMQLRGEIYEYGVFYCTSHRAFREK